MNSGISLNVWDLIVFCGYVAVSVGLGFWVSRNGRQSAQGYFLGDRQLPWYVVGTSMVATVVSTEHFIAQVGAAYSQGIVVAAFTWNAWIVYTLLVWIFLPYYMRSGVFTMPEFLERRYSPALRYLFAVSLALGYVASIIAGSLYAGGLAIESVTGLDIRWGIWGLALLTGAYTVYGGLKSAAWTDFMQMIVILAGGLMVPILGLIKTGGVLPLMREFPEKFVLFHPPSHPVFPATGVFTGFLSIGLWYNCASQHIVQRCLGARDEWHARMGVVAAGFLQICVPFLFVLPGIIAWKLHPGLERPDYAYLVLIRDLIPSGLRGLILAAMAAALMSTLSSMINSTSTVVTLDLYRRLLRPEATERQQVRVGQWSGALALAAGVGIALYYATLKDSFLFILIQDVFAYIAPPFAVIFAAGILWRRANATGALASVVLGLPFSYLLRNLLAPGINYLHRALFAWMFCVAVMVTVSLVTRAPEAKVVDGMIWNFRYAQLPAELAARYSGWRDFRVWWLAFVVVVIALYTFFFWFGLR
ncbi:MAG: hypothetical protein EXQ52_09220 [Bryobacterales bacterium]|nr:hypothetical protein [Bryobacterales bacterium]